jgi:hypothetical protein
VVISGSFRQLIRLEAPRDPGCEDQKTNLVEHLTQKQVEAYCQSQLQVAELLPVTDHLGECETCRRHIQGALNSDAAFFTMRAAVFGDDAEILSAHPESAHLTAEQMADYVDGQPSGDTLQTVDDHLSSCEQCAIAIDDLRAFKNRIAPSLDREYHPASVSAPREGWWRRTVASLALFRAFPTPAFGAALALLLLAGTGWLIWRTVREREPKQEIVVAPAPSLQPSLSVQPAPAPSQPESVRVVAQLKDGGSLLTLDQEGKLSGADELPPAYQSMVKKALNNGRVEKSSQLNGLTRPPSSLMSSDKQRGEFSVIEPVGNVLMTNQPTFRWSPMEGAMSYVVEVYDDKFKLAATSLQITNHSWVVPQSLSRGMVYSWQVKANKQGQEITSPRPPVPQAKFRVLDQAKANELSKAKRAYASSHLTLGLLYAEAGLLKEAEQELRALQKANPDSELARSLLRHVQALRRRSE